MTDWTIIYEQGDDGGWWARAADLPVFAAGDTREQAECEVAAAIGTYLEHLRETGQPVLRGRSEVGTVSVESSLP